MNSAQAKVQSMVSRIEKRDRGFRQVRAAVFSVLAACAYSSSRPDHSPFWVYAASALVVLFLALMVLHQRLKDRLKLWRARAIFGRQLTALRDLERSKKESLSPALISEFADSHLVRDLDLLSSDGFISYFPFFVTTEGFKKFVRRFVEAPPSRDEILMRQSRVRFWERATVLRRAVLRQAAGVGEMIDMDGLRRTAGSALSSRTSTALYGQLFVLVCCQLLMLAGFVFGVKAMAYVALMLWLGGYAVFARGLDIFAAYPRGMQLGRDLRVLMTMAVLAARATRSAGQSQSGVDALAGEQGPLPVLTEVERAAGALGLRQNPILALLINFVVPWDFFWTIKLELARRHLADRIGDWAEAMAQLEVNCVLAEWNRAHGQVWPEFVETTGFGIESRGLVHPLLSPSRRVANSLRLDSSERCHLVTGSNMAGKSTFLRAIGLNVLLAQAGAKVPCERLRLEPLRVETSLRPSDSLADGFSSFYAEVADLVGILDRAKSAVGPTGLYLIDEIFRGTNNRERRIGAESVIRELAKTSAFGLVTTHDLDLASLEGQVDGLRNHHFRDNVREGVMTFTYEYQRGPCPSTNAIKVMRKAGLPVAVDEAER